LLGSDLLFFSFCLPPPTPSRAAPATPARCPTPQPPCPSSPSWPVCPQLPCVHFQTQLAPNERRHYYVLMCISPALWLRLTSECFQTPAPQSSQSPVVSLVSIKFSFMSSERFDFNIEKHVVSYFTLWQFFVIVVVFFCNRSEFHVINSREIWTT